MRWVVAFGRSATLRRGVQEKRPNDRPLESIAQEEGKPAAGAAAARAKQPQGKSALPALSRGQGLGAGAGAGAVGGSGAAKVGPTPGRSRRGSLGSEPLAALPPARRPSLPPVGNPRLPPAQGAGAQAGGAHPMPARRMSVPGWLASFPEGNGALTHGARLDLQQLRQEDEAADGAGAGAGSAPTRSARPSGSAVLDGAPRPGLLAKPLVDGRRRSSLPGSGAPSGGIAAALERKLLQANLELEQRAALPGTAVGMFAVPRASGPAEPMRRRSVAGYGESGIASRRGSQAKRVSVTMSVTRMDGDDQFGVRM